MEWRGSKWATIILALLVFLPIGVIGQGDFEPEMPSREQNSWSDHDAWRESIKDLEYNTEKRPEPKVQEEPANWDIDTPDIDFWDGFSGISVFMIIIAAAGLIVLIVFIAKNTTGDSRVDKRIVTEITEEEIRENLPELEIDGHIKLAIANKQFKKAIRLYYLRILQELIANAWVLWKPDKTNSHYLGEMRSQISFRTFKDVTQTFEWVWYSDFLLDEKEFLILEPTFQGYLNQLRIRE